MSIMTNQIHDIPGMKKILICDLTDAVLIDEVFQDYLCHLKVQNKFINLKSERIFDAFQFCIADL